MRLFLPLSVYFLFAFLFPYLLATTTVSYPPIQPNHVVSIRPCSCDLEAEHAQRERFGNLNRTAYVEKCRKV